MRLDFNYSISLRSKLDPDSHFICSFGFEDTFDAAMKKAVDVLLDPAYAYITGYASSAIVRTDFVEHESAGLDYGAPDRFMIVKKQEVNHVVSVWRADFTSSNAPRAETALCNGFTC